MKKMLILSTGNVEEFDDGYAQRLYDQGKAVYAAEEAGKAEEPAVSKAPEQPEEETEKPAEEAPKSAKGKKTR